MPVDDERVAAVLDALRAAGASFALAFGSRARGGHRADSDLDVAAWWPARPPQAWEVELPGGIDLVVLNRAPLELAGRIAIEGVVLYEEDPAARVRWVAQARKVWLNERPRFEAAHRIFLEAAAHGR